VVLNFEDLCIYSIKEKIMKVENELKVYEVNGDFINVNKPSLKVSSHWNKNEFVILQFDDDKKYAVLARELSAAIKNAQNTADI
jgi:predicted peptidase